MEKSCFKVFFSKNKECRWLNSMGEKGYLLTKIKDNKYYFTHSKKHTYSYSIEHLDSAIQSEEAEKYFASLEEKGIVPIIYGGCWVYFSAINKTIQQTCEIHKKNSSVYFWRALYLLFFSCVGAVLCGYHAFAADFIVNVGHMGKGRIPLFDIKGDSLLDTLKDVLNHLFDFLSDTYIKLFTMMFGENDAALALSVLIPATIVITVFFALNIYEYFVCRKLAKSHKEATNAK